MSPNVEEIFASVDSSSRVAACSRPQAFVRCLIPSGNNARGGATGGTIYVDNNAVCGLRSSPEHAIPVPFGIVCASTLPRPQ